MVWAGERRGKWSKYYSILYVGFVIALVIGNMVAAYVRENTGSWATYLILPLVMTMFIAFLLINRKKFDNPATKKAPAYPTNGGDGTGKCAWCSKPCAQDYCSKECEGAYERYEQRLDKLTYPFILCLLVMLALLVAPFSAGFTQLGVGLMVAGYGALLVIFPTTIPGTVNDAGVKNSLRISRIFGLIMMIIGGAVIMYAPPV